MNRIRPGLIRNIVGVCLFSAISSFLHLAAYAGTMVGTVSSPSLKHPGDAVVYLEGVKGEFPLPNKNPVMDQKALTFIPYVLPILKGTTVDFANSDLVYHNVFSPAKIKKFDLGRYGPGKVRQVKFDKAGLAPILCNVHTEMEAYVVVLDNPFFAIAGKDGKFKIEGVPAGKYTVSIWHSRAKAKGKEVTVPEEGEVTIDFELGS